ncbi:tRNA-dihydrouridine(20a/20b) synthase [NAD(P)+]-like [Lingula anatina]|uniref:tRNA-dihydrouridine(20a/20b) synthase [NAD(P)+]-like n=1 Tax=Lingula anatina TaxID=7574 RepID=A0A1S3J8L5_LINAN|nr:tRNA-dihydrouridine(20a/20b) synthase [NAD(P)+]-like [Lingula anatina]|eukprot:XP_013406740.1 tRNA-dihydrouridine(20a/20b) synthase [NAD(P)+]-like [Lingula anatina]
MNISESALRCRVIRYHVLTLVGLVRNSGPLWTYLPEAIDLPRVASVCIETVDLCQKAEKAGVSWIAVHGRTVDQRCEPVNVEALRLVTDSLTVPVIANGDIRSVEDAKRIQEVTGVNGVMAARGILQNPAMYAGYDATPVQCVRDWLDIALSQGLSFTTFHHHLMYMLEKVMSRSERRLFNSLSSITAVLDYLREYYGIG